jgi:phosphatidate cytidylyltransferase
MASFALILYGRSAHYPLCIAALTMVSLSWAITRSWEPKEALERAGRMWIGWVYVPLIAWIGVLVSMQRPDVPWIEQEGLLWLFFCMICVFAGDSGAYLAGRAFGKTKLAPSVSPKKTWEGVAGGVLLAEILAGWFWYGVLAERTSVELGVGGLIGLVCLVVSAGIVGDLCESLLKRAYDVKDTGRIMPGHGGVLDRLDSLMFAVPVTLVFLRVVG